MAVFERISVCVCLCVAQPQAHGMHIGHFICATQKPTLLIGYKIHTFFVVVVVVVVCVDAAQLNIWYTCSHAKVTVLLQILYFRSPWYRDRAQVYEFVSITWDKPPNRKIYWFRLCWCLGASRKSAWNVCCGADENWIKLYVVEPPLNTQKIDSSFFFSCFSDSQKCSGSTRTYCRSIVLNNYMVGGGESKCFFFFFHFR